MVKFENEKKKKTADFFFCSLIYTIIFWFTATFQISLFLFLVSIKPAEKSGNEIKTKNG